MTKPKRKPLAVTTIRLSDDDRKNLKRLAVRYESRSDTLRRLITLAAADLR